MDIIINKVEHIEQRGFKALSEGCTGFFDAEYYSYCFEKQFIGDMSIFMACHDGRGVGHCILNWVPRYSLFKKLGVPEIQDLNVLPEYRRQGIGGALIAFCEEQARARGGDMTGIGVGMDASFGAAQRLYVKMGYVPDGCGVTYDRKQVGTGEFKPVDDQLCLMMMKDLT